VRLLGKRSTDDLAEDRIAVDLEAMPGEVSSVVIAASLDAADGVGFDDVGDLSVEIRDVSGTPRARFEVPDAGVETAMVLGELYLRGEEWKFRAVGQGWDSGLAGLATGGCGSGVRAAGASIISTGSVPTQCHRTPFS
jgi:stress response protein SCP2